MSDGSLVFDTKIDTTGAENGIAKLRVKLSKATNDVQKQTAEVQRLENEMRKLQTTQVPTAQYAELKAAMEKADAQLMSLIDRQDKYLATGGKTKGAQWERLQYDIEAVSAKVREYQSQMAAMEADGTAFTVDRAGAADLSAKLDTAKIKLSELQVKEQEAGSNLKQSMTPAVPAFNNMSSALDRFGKRLSNTIKSALIFSVMYKGLSVLREYMGNALQTNSAFTSSLAQLKGALLTAFQPIFSACVPALITLLNVLTSVISAIAKFFALLSGKGLSATIASAKATDNEARAIGNKAKAISGAGKAAEDASKSMAGFDEINQLDDKSSGGSGGGGGGADAGGINPSFEGLDEAAEKFRVIRDVVEAILAGLLAWKIASEFTDDLGKIWGLALAVGGAILLAKGYWDAWNNGVSTSNMIEIFVGLAAVIAGLALAFGYGLVPMIAAVVGGLALLTLGIKDIVQNGASIQNVTTAFMGLLVAVGGLLLIFGPVVAGIVAVVGGIALLVLGIMDANKNGVTWANTLLEISGIMAMGLGIALLTGSWIPLLIAAIVALVVLIVQRWTEIKEFFAQLWEDIKNIFSTAWDFIRGIWEKVAGWFSTNVIEPIKTFFSPLTDWFKTLFEGMWLIVEAIWKIVADWFNNTVVQPIIKFFSPIVETIGGLFSRLWDNVKAIWEKVAEWFSKYVTEPIQKAWETAFNAMNSFVKGIFNGILGFFERVINGIISALNGFMAGFNAIATKAGEIVGKDFSGFGTISPVSVPRLAAGAVIPPNRQFLAVLGDQTSGTNVEAPLSTIQQAVLEALAQSGGVGGGRDITIVLELDHTEFGRVVYKANNEETQRVGLRLAGAH